MSGKKGSKSPQQLIGGSAIPGAKSTQPKQYTENANPQQQQLESYNREMRRRMERLGGNEDDDRARSIQKQRQKKADRLKERRETELARVKRSLPGGKINMNMRNVYIMVAVVALIIVLVIAAFLIFR